MFIISSGLFLSKLLPNLAWLNQSGGIAGQPSRIFTKGLRKYCIQSNKRSGKPKQIQKTSSIVMATKKIGTHDGVFHCDESLACFLIKRLPQYSDAEIIRSRQEDCLKTCDIVVDVGGVYDHQTKRYDHHQKSFQLAMADIFPQKTKLGNIKLSSAGLIFAHYGHEIIANLLEWEKNDSTTDTVFDMVYDNFIKEIDAIDNGITMFDGEPKYRITTNLSARVGNLNPRWNEKNNDQILYERFMQAIELTGKEFLDRVDYYGHSWLPARKLVLEAFKNRHKHDPNGHIVVLLEYCPWMFHLFQIEQEHDVEGQIYYVIYREKDAFRVRAMPVAEQSFKLRIPLHQDWRGLNGEQLSETAKIPDCIFVHSTGFIGGNKTLDGALHMARKSIAAQQDNHQINGSKSPSTS